MPSRLTCFERVVVAVLGVEDSLLDTDVARNAVAGAQKLLQRRKRIESDLDLLKRLSAQVDDSRVLEEWGSRSAFQRAASRRKRS